MTHFFDVDVARKYGVDEAIVLAHLSFWIQKNAANEKHFHDGRYWTYMSLDAFEKIFPYWSHWQIRRILKRLIDKKVVLSGVFNSVHYDHTNWYTLSDKLTGELQNRTFDGAESHHRRSEIAPPIPYIDTDKDNTPFILTSNDVRIPPKGETHKIFKPPSVEEVKAYCDERRNGINPQAFIDFYESKGWLIGKNRMKDWKAAVRTWEHKNRQEQGVDVNYGYEGMKPL